MWVVGGVVGWAVRLGVIIKSNLNRVRLSCCWVGVGLGCDNSLEISWGCSVVQVLVQERISLQPWCSGRQ